MGPKFALSVVDFPHTMANAPRYPIRGKLFDAGGGLTSVEEACKVPWCHNL
jgi:hypothetical protein